MRLKTSENSGSYNAKASVAFFSAIIATVFASFYWLGRFGFEDNSILLTLKILSISYFLLFLPSACRRAADYFGLTFGRSWYASDAFISLLGISLVTITGFIIQSFNFIVLLPFIFFGCLFFIINLVSFFFKDNLRNNLIFCFLGLSFSILLVFIYCSNGGSTPPLLFEDLTREHAPGDTLFHSAIAQMIKTYGIPSTGLNGVPYIPYHYGSHFIFAQLSKLLDLNMFIFYQFGFTIIFIPFLFNSILSFIIDLKKYFSYSIENWNLRTDYKFWILFALPFIGFLPVRVMNRLYTKDWIVLSESYALGMSFFFIMASLLIYFFGKFDNERKNFKKGDYVFVILILPLLLGIIGMMKQPLLFLCVVALGYLFFRLRLYKNKVIVFSALSVVTVSFIVFKLVHFRDPNAFKLVFFHFIRQYLIVDKINKPFFWIFLIPSFLILHFFWSWLYIVLRVREEKIKRIAAIENVFKSGKFVDIELLLLLCIVGLLPGTLLRVTGGVLVYFSDFQRWVALSLFLSRYSNFSLPYKKLQVEKVKTTISLLLLVIVVGSFLGNAVISSKITMGQYFMVRNSLLDLSQPQKSLYENQKYKMYKTLLELDKIPLSEKKRALLFIPKSNRLYWDSLDPYSLPLVVPAIAGIAMIDGLSEKRKSSNFPWQQWCNHVYKSTAEDEQLQGASAAVVYSKVLGKGFSKLIVIENKDGNTVVTKIP